MFIGEAPGELEDVTGVPFVSVAGRILNQLFEHVPYQFQYLITNAVGCRPVTVYYLDDKMEGKPLSELQLGDDYELDDWNRDPSPGEIEQCRPHIHELVDNWEPHGIVYLGKIARKAFPPKSIKHLELYHPAYIARMEYKLLTVIKEARKLEKFIEEIENN